MVVLRIAIIQEKYKQLFMFLVVIVLNSGFKKYLSIHLFDLQSAIHSGAHNSIYSISSSYFPPKQPYEVGWTKRRIIWPQVTQ